MAIYWQIKNIMPTDKPFVRFELKSLRLLVKFLYTL